ncbi:DUF4271 domain-containing protein [Pedobacter sp. SYSU D00535]|uniref:DUF4271 domain-containing protein n=1 Tax=Pedobacter sp. SYSU D00535 TaxID=2810308 RepID=UPI001A956634|nr:DUF4271 domain-containing protein [Pedobacter sp. SYSU D00535]
MSHKWFVLSLLLLLSALSSIAQTDSAQDATSQPRQIYRRPVYLDSTALALRQARKDSIQRAQDSLKAIGDSLALVWIKRPDPNRPNRFLDSLMEEYQVKNLDFAAWAAKFPKKEKRYMEGSLRKKGEVWVIAIIFLLLSFFAILRNLFAKELNSIMHAFYSNRVLGQINKEDRFFNSWPFVFLYLLFGFTIGLFLYQCGKYFQLSYSYTGFDWFVRLSVVVIAVYTLKILVVRLLGFLFDARKMVKEYVSILYLSYFNAALLFLPIVIAFSLSPARYAPFYIYISFLLIGCTFFFQFLRAITNILSGHKFPIIYLFIYLCALEICPILILVKALRF